MATFIRFMRGATLAEATANAQADLERGFSFAGYASYESEEAARESDEVVYLGVDADTIAQHADGTWGFALGGLCGYEYDAENQAATEFPYAANAAFYAIYEGRYIGQADQGDGDMFRPTTLVTVAAL